MSQEIAITFDDAGNARTLWTDALDLAALGTLDVTRASTIEFNAALQCWEVIFPDDGSSPAYSHPSRAECLRWEHEEANRRLMEGTH